MNDLNSVLLEGQIIGDPKRIEREGKKDLLVFEIESKREVHYKEQLKIHYNYFKVQLVDNGENVKSGDYIRVVGQLTLCHIVTTIEETRINADHLEVKPVKREKNE